MRTGLPWRDLPPLFGKWISIYQQFNRWSSKNKLMNIFRALVQATDLEWEFIDGSIVKAINIAQERLAIIMRAIGKSVAGNTTKIHLAVDSYGLPIDFILTGGQVHDSKATSEFIAQLPNADYTIADKGYDKEELREQIKQKGSIPVIPRKSNSTIGNDDMDWGLYKLRHLVENIFARLKHFRAIATRYDKLRRNYQAMLSLACAFLWLPM